MKRLSTEILKDWEIAENRPSRVRILQLGDSATLMGLIDRLIDDANTAGADLGVAVVQTALNGHAGRLKQQGGAYTCVVRGELNDERISRDQVVQCVPEAIDPVAEPKRLKQLSADPAVELVLLERDVCVPDRDAYAVSVSLTAELLVERYRARLAPPSIVIVSDELRAPELLRAELKERVGDRAGFEAWLTQVGIYASFTDSMVSRCTPAEAARLCARWNYLDEMIHIGEPYAQWYIAAPEVGLLAMLKQCGQIVLKGDISSELLRRQRLFDAGLCAFAALGSLHADGTLAECLKDEPLRRLVGNMFTEELLPYLPMEREAAGTYLIACFERYTNAMNENAVPDCVPGMLGRIRYSLIPAIRAYDAENYTMPVGLVSALAAALLLYADVRLRDGVWSTVLGGDPVPLVDDPELLEAFSTMASDMPAEALAYAILADRTIWGEDLREIDGLEQALTSAFSARLADADMIKGK